MKKALMMILFLSVIIMTTQLKNKKDSLVKRINNAFKMFSIANFVEEYTPSKYAEKLLDEDLEVDSLSIKIQLVRDSISAVLDHLGFEEGVILKVAAAKVSNLMDSMDLFVGIAKGQKEGKDLVDLVGMIPDLTDTTTFTNKLKNADKVKDAIDFIKDIIHPDSVVNKKPADRKSGKSARKSKLIVDPTDESLEAANAKLQKQKAEDDLNADNSDDNLEDKKEVENDNKLDDDTDELKTQDNLEDGEEGLKEGDEAETPALRKSNRKSNNKASKKNPLGNFGEVTTAKRVSKGKGKKVPAPASDENLDELLGEKPDVTLDDPEAEKSTDGLTDPASPVGDKLTDPASPVGDKLNPPGINREDAGEQLDDATKTDKLGDKEADDKSPVGDKLNSDESLDEETEGNKLDDKPVVVKREAKKKPAKRDDPKKKEDKTTTSKRMNSKKNKKIRGLTRKNKRLTPRFMSDDEIVHQKKQEVNDVKDTGSDQFSFISLREDNRNLKGKPTKPNKKKAAKAHRKRKEDPVEHLVDETDNGLSEQPKDETPATSRKASGDDEDLTNDDDSDLKGGDDRDNKEADASADLVDDRVTEEGLNDDEDKTVVKGSRKRAHKH